MRKKILKSLIYLSGGAAIVALILAVNYFTMAWTEPTSAPPNGYVGLNSLDSADGSPTDAIYVDNDGNVGIGDTTPSAPLDVNGNLKVGSFYFDGNDDGWLRLRDNDDGNYKDLAVGKLNSTALNVIPASNAGWLTVDSSDDTGNLILKGVNKNSPASGNLATIWLSGHGAIINQDSWYLTTQDPPWVFAIGNVSGGSWHSNIELYPGTSDVHVVGELTATTKTFVIDHPTKPGKKLRYGSLEGPEYGVYVRGEKEDDKMIDLPDYWTGLVHADSITVQLTPKGSWQKLWVEKIEDNKVYINSDSKNVKYYYYIQAERKDVDKMKVEYSE